MTCYVEEPFCADHVVCVGPFLCSLPQHIPLPIFDDLDVLLAGASRNETKVRLSYAPRST
jgi:hypothetical protein